MSTRQGTERAPQAERAADLYETPECVTQALLRHELIPQNVWEPAAGRGAISRLLIECGFNVVAHDLLDYPGRDPHVIPGHDFLLAETAPAGVEAIVTNPPYSLADKFVRKGLALGLPVIVLLRLVALEGARRSDLIDSHLTRVWIGRERPPFLHRDGWEGPKQETSTMPFAWMVFDPTPRPGRSIAMRRISWRS